MVNANVYKYGVRLLLGILLIACIAVPTLVQYDVIWASDNITEPAPDTSNDIDKPMKPEMERKDNQALKLVRSIPAVTFAGETSYVDITTTLFSSGDIVCEYQDKSFTIKSPSVVTETWGKTKDAYSYYSASRKFGDTWYDFDTQAYNDRILVEFRGLKSTNNVNIQFESTESIYYDDINKVIWFGDTIGFDFADAIQNSYFDIKTKQLTFEVTPDESFFIDPSVVASSTANTIGAPSQRHAFYNNGRHWVFYSDGTSAYYKSSTDGSSWSAATLIESGIEEGWKFGLYFDGTNVHYASCDFDSGDDIYYRRGVPEADGTITWAAATQTAWNLPSGWYMYAPSIAVDDTGHAFIAIQRYSDSDLYVIENANNDGTWATASTDLLSNGGCTSKPSISARTAGKMFCAWSDGSNVKYSFYDGAAWGAATTLDVINGNYDPCTANNGDDIYITYYSLSDSKVLYDIYTGGAWTGAAEVTTRDDTWPMVTDLGAGNFIIFYGDTTTDHMYYKRYQAAVLGSEVDFVDDSTDDFAVSMKSGFSATNGGYIGFAWLSGLASPFDVKYEFSAGVTAPTITTVAASGATADTVRLNAYINDDGGEPVEIRWGYGTSSQSCNCTAYDTCTSYSGAYITGNSPYLDLSGLTCNTTYYFCAHGQNSGGTATGGELSFTTGNCTIEEPEYFVGTPTTTEIVLTWVRGGGASGTEIRYSEGCGVACPTANTTGLPAYDGTDTFVTISNLVPGTSYCFKAWGYAGSTWSTGNTTLCVTTLGTVASSESFEQPLQPSGWFQSPDYTRMSNFFMYSAINNFADYFTGMPTGTVWLGLFLLVSVALTGVVFALAGRSLVWSLAFMTLLLAAGWKMGIVPFWMILPVLMGTIAAGAIKQKGYVGT